MLGSSTVAERLVTSQEGFISLELVTKELNMRALYVRFARSKFVTIRYELYVNAEFECYSFSEVLATM
jgi:hypothetical protein